MDYRLGTIIVLAIGAALFVVWDVYVAICDRRPISKSTISEVLFGWSTGVWILPYGFGVLLGHLFLPVSPFSLTEWPRWFCIVVLLISGFVVTVLGILIRRKSFQWSWPYQAPILLFLGILAGHILWYQ